MKRELALQIAMQFIGKPYIWAGNDPMAGFDCSGFIIELLKSVGILPREGDWTAHSLSEKWLETPNIKPGTLLFWDWDNNGTIDHVEIVLAVISTKEILTIGASGGQANIKTTQDAIDNDAYIKVRPARLNWDRATDPFLQ